MKKRLSVGRATAFALLALPCPAAMSAQDIQNYCASAKEEMSQDAGMATAAKAAFPNAKFATRDDNCLFPITVLKYGDADVLITTAAKPGEDCHGCGAHVSAYVLQRMPGRMKTVARFVDFTEIGTSGEPGEFKAVQLAGHDAFGIESGGTFQGYTSSSLSLFVFEARKLVELKPFLPLSADNDGAGTEPEKTIEIEGSWHVDPAHPADVSIAYRVKAGGHERQSAATWTIDGGTLKLTSGRIPPEYENASGN